MLELFFLLSFTFHNIEEALWLPQWSRFAARFHKQVSRNEFLFGLISVTVFGYLLTLARLTWNVDAVRYLYLGFILMMCVNAVFPHLLATIVLKRYAPGTLTGLLLNLPAGILILGSSVNGYAEWGWVLLSCAVVGGAVLVSLGPLFSLGGRLLKDY